MLTQGDDVEVHALAARGCSIAAIARHIGRDRRTVRAYLRGDRMPGVRHRSVPDPLGPFIPYITARFDDDPHLWLTTLIGELVPLGYPRSYPTFVRAVRAAGLRPHCEPCHGVSGRATIEIEHPRGPRSSGTGSSAGRRPGAAPRSCSWAPCLTRAGSGACSPRRSTRLTSSRRWMRSCGAWAGPRPARPR